MTKKIQRALEIGVDEKARLEKIAPLFDISFSKKENGLESSYVLVVKEGRETRSAALRGESAHVRLLAELCEKTLHWVYFSEKEHCAITLLALSDAKLHRIGQLYLLRERLQKDAPVTKRCTR